MWAKNSTVYFCNNLVKPRSVSISFAHLAYYDKFPIMLIHFRFLHNGKQRSGVLANVNSRLRSLYAIIRPSVCRLSVVYHVCAPVRPTQAIEIFGNVSTPFGTLAICDLSIKVLRRSSQENPSVEGGGLNQRGIAKYSDSGPFKGYIPETVQNRR